MINVKNHKIVSKLTGYEKRRLDYKRKKSYQKQERIFKEMVRDECLRKKCLDIGKISSYVTFLENFAKLFPNKVVFENQLKNENKTLEFPKKWKYVMSHCRCIDSRNFIDGIRTPLKKLGLYPQSTQSDRFLYMPDAPQNNYKLKGRKRIKIQEKLPKIKKKGKRTKKKILKKKRVSLIKEEENSSGGGGSSSNSQCDESFDLSTRKEVPMTDPIEILINLHKFKPPSVPSSQKAKKEKRSQTLLIKTEGNKKNFEKSNFNSSLTHYPSQNQNQNQNFNQNKNFDQLKNQLKNQLKIEQNNKRFLNLFNNEPKNIFRRNKNNNTSILSFIKSENRIVNKIKVENENVHLDMDKGMGLGMNININSQHIFKKEKQTNNSVQKTNDLNNQNNSKDGKLFSFVKTVINQNRKEKEKEKII
ncbi:hypothetical protein M0812_18583 [Anaeramoeba flamelloides]|uniref:Uncharacterized protein n=1 Tax=Anaeramoeba flamelloides TaxID=1746091 RepID=A0AAV7Z8Z2_9EUKA|nr:hypothetical protein M0812_18583 [Anaeramoeba flamelloides]